MVHGSETMRQAESRDLIIIPLHLPAGTQVLCWWQTSTWWVGVSAIDVR